METKIILNIGALELLVGIVMFFLGLLAIVWKGKKEISDTIDKKLKPFELIAHAITEIQTVIKNKLKGINIQYSLVERGSSPLMPTEYGAKLIKDSGLEKILNDNKDFLRTKLKASLNKDYAEYDVQEKSRDLLVSLKDDPIMKPVKMYVYDHPIDIEIILRAGGLWLRDDFLGKVLQVSKSEENI